jgi:hypothetical protein
MKRLPKFDATRIPEYITAGLVILFGLLFPVVVYISLSRPAPDCQQEATGNLIEITILINNVPMVVMMPEYVVVCEGVSK